MNTKENRNKTLTPGQREKLRRIRHLALDMDGTIYMENNIFPFTIPTLDALKAAGVGHSFLTNNPTKSVGDYVAKLKRMGIDCAWEDMYTTPIATIDYIKKTYPEVKRLFMLGTPSMREQFVEAGFVSCEDDPADKPDMLVLFAAGNNNESIAYDNNCTISPQCSAKNVLTVGAAETYRPDVNYTYGVAFEAKDRPFKDDLVASPANGEQQGMAMFSSRGPCKDGRFKPEIVAPGTYIISTESGYDTTNEKYPNRQNLYTVMFGTSMATPLTAGAAADTIQFLKEKGVANPSSALVKATLIHGARRMGQGQYDAPYIEIPDDFPNSVNGYGHVDLGQSFDLTNNVVYIEGVVSNQNDLVTYAFKKNSMGRVKATLVWTDQPGTPGAREELVNDLDLQVFDGLDTHFNANQSMHNEYTNNSEWYDSPNDPAAGEDMEVRVHGYSGMYYPQSFALVVSGMDEGPIPEPSLAFAFLSLCGLLIFRKK